MENKKVNLEKWIKELNFGIEKRKELGIDTPDYLLEDLNRYEVELHEIEYTEHFEKIMNTL